MTYRPVDGPANSPLQQPGPRPRCLNGAYLGLYSGCHFQGPGPGLTSYTLPLHQELLHFRTVILMPRWPNVNIVCFGMQVWLWPLATICHICYRFDNDNFWLALTKPTNRRLSACASAKACCNNWSSSIITRRSDICNRASDHPWCNGRGRRFGQDHMEAIPWDSPFAP